ncbi:cytochrome c-type biogenesis protein [Cardiobacterium valvarum]|uniref:Cytochrome c-type biogenesis protein n=1 Tax=Cardiobacterium valvarum TaxID=194702 RepID=A0A381DXJ5_9GAMM|nr:cytochrome c-type biogenesis protein [Cardiobacterium valvarum]SUX17973.1 Cytochrome c-type biogenesis protein CcmH precursor [Cardiobacterium valvarum]
MKRLLPALLLACTLPLHAALSDAPAFTQPGDNARYQALIKKTRCPTCQNSDIAESNAPLARQLREQIARQIQEGRSDSEIAAWLQARYGDFVTYDPPLKSQTLALWLAPFAAMLAAAAWWWRARRRHPVAHRLSDAEKRELQQWVAETEKN